MDRASTIETCLPANQGSSRVGCGIQNAADRDGRRKLPALATSVSRAAIAARNASGGKWL